VGRLVVVLVYGDLKWPTRSGRFQPGRKGDPRLQMEIAMERGQGREYDMAGIGRERARADTVDRNGPSPRLTAWTSSNRGGGAVKGQQTAKKGDDRGGGAKPFPRKFRTPYFGGLRVLVPSTRSLCRRIEHGRNWLAPVRMHLNKKENVADSKVPS